MVRVLLNCGADIHAVDKVLRSSEPYNLCVDRDSERERERERGGRVEKRRSKG